MNQNSPVNAASIGSGNPVMPQTQIVQWGENLKNSISANNKLVAELEERLVRIMRSESDCGPQSNQMPPPEEYLVPMAHSIRDATGLVDQSNVRLQSLLSRCEL